MATTRPLALVTGASTGIGAAYAAELATRGYDLLLVARDPVRLSAVAGRLGARHGVRTEALALDLSDPAALDLLERRLSRNDIELAVNNAGVANPGPLFDHQPPALAGALAVNVVAVTRIARAVLPGMAARSRGGIINIASVTGLMNDRPGISVPYSASKAYVLSFSEGLAAELADLGIRVQAVLPGATRTPIWGKSGLDVDALLGPDAVMDADILARAAMAGFDAGETVTIPTLEDLELWRNFTLARAALYPQLSGARPASRYHPG